MMKTEYLSWTLNYLKRSPDSEWVASYDKYIQSLITPSVVGKGHTPEAALASAQKEIQLKERE